MRAFFVCARVREARKRGWENFEFFGIFGNCEGGWNEMGLSGGEFERKRKIFGFLGFLSFLGFKRDVDHYVFFLRCNIY